MRKIYAGIAVAVLGVVTSVWAEPNRPFYSLENRMPELNQVELGSWFDYAQFNESGGISGTDWKRKEYTVDPYARYGLAENLSLYADVPYGWIKSDRYDSSEQGFRDMNVGLQLLAYEYTLGYPYVMPYVFASFASGDEDKGLGAGRTTGTFGTSIGTTVNDIYHYVLDGRYRFNNPDNADVFFVSTAFIWDLSKRFSLVAEAQVEIDSPNNDNKTPLYFKGGMCYRATDNLDIYWYGGTTSDSDEDGSADMKVAYNF